MCLVLSLDRATQMRPYYQEEEEAGILPCPFASFTVPHPPSCHHAYILFTTTETRTESNQYIRHRFDFDQRRSRRFHQSDEIGRRAEDLAVHDTDGARPAYGLTRYLAHNASTR
jgi:hypothetical protein